MRVTKRASRGRVAVASDPRGPRRLGRGLRPRLLLRLRGGGGGVAGALRGGEERLAFGSAAPFSEVRDFLLGRLQRRRQSRRLLRTLLIVRAEHLSLAARRLRVARERLATFRIFPRRRVRFFRPRSESFDVILRATQFGFERDVFALRGVERAAELGDGSLQRRALVSLFRRLRRHPRHRRVRRREFPARLPEFALRLVDALLERRGRLPKLANLRVARLKLRLGVAKLSRERLSLALRVRRCALRRLFASLSRRQIFLESFRATRKRLRRCVRVGVGVCARRRLPPRALTRASHPRGFRGGARRSTPRRLRETLRGGDGRGERLGGFGGVVRVSHLRRVLGGAIPRGFRPRLGEGKRRRGGFFGRGVTPAPRLGPHGIAGGGFRVGAGFVGGDVGGDGEGRGERALVEVPRRSAAPRAPRVGSLRGCGRGGDGRGDGTDGDPRGGGAQALGLRLAELRLVIRLHVAESLGGFIGDVATRLSHAFERLLERAIARVFVRLHLRGTEKTRDGVHHLGLVAAVFAQKVRLRRGCRGRFRGFRRLYVGDGLFRRIRLRTRVRGRLLREMREGGRGRVRLLRRFRGDLLRRFRGDRDGVGGGSVGGVRRGFSGRALKRVSNGGSRREELGSAGGDVDALGQVEVCLDGGLGSVLGSSGF